MGKFNKQEVYCLRKKYFNIVTEKDKGDWKNV